MKSRKWTADEKLAIVMEGLKERRSVTKISREDKISLPVAGQIIVHQRPIRLCRRRWQEGFG